MSIGAARLFMCSLSGNPMDVHLHTSVNLRRWLLKQDSISLKRLTVIGGLRIEQLEGYLPSQSSPPSRFATAGIGGFAAQPRFFQLDEHGRVALDSLSIERRGSSLFVFINGRLITELEIDKRVADGKIYVPFGLTATPGHGKTPGPFSPDRADSCARALVGDLAARKAILPERTILAGHSLGGAIAIRIAAKFRVAGVIALSPAPMHTTSGVSAEMIPFQEGPTLAPHSLVLSAEWEPRTIKSQAQELVTASRDSSNKYQTISGATHVTIMFSSTTFAELRAWTAQVLGTNPGSLFPRTMPALGCILGLTGLSLLAPPFLREMHPARERQSVNAAKAPSYLSGLLPLVATAFAAVLLLASHVVPFRFVRVFQGDYFGVFLFLIGFAVLILRRKLFPPPSSFLSPAVASTAASAFILVLLFAAWFELTFYEAWLTPAKWLRFPLLFLLVLPWHLAEEIYLGASSVSPNFIRLAKALGLRTAVWLIILFGILVLHSGEIFFVLLLAYFALFSILQRLACDLVRFRTQSSAATAFFGAILLAGFALAIFPVA